MAVRVTHYVVKKIINGKTTIDLRYVDGSSTSLTGLSNDEARFIIDLLRQEKPINYLKPQKLLTFGELEPTGEAE
jgi:hypothetical protein